jgi:hypothetical protein
VAGGTAGPGAILRAGVPHRTPPSTAPTRGGRCPLRRSSVVERVTVNHLVVGSNPTAGANFHSRNTRNRSPGSSSPSHGWVGWLAGDILLAWQHPEIEQQGLARWDGRSPFTDAIDELEDQERTEGFARLAAAIVCHMWDLEEQGLAYLPAADASDRD